jgi:hypothetical protein
LAAVGLQATQLLCSLRGALLGGGYQEKPRLVATLAYPITTRVQIREHQGSAGVLFPHGFPQPFRGLGGVSSSIVSVEVSLREK